MAKLLCPGCGIELKDEATACLKCGFSDTAFFHELKTAIQDVHQTAPVPDFTGKERRRHLRLKQSLHLLLNDVPALLINISIGGMRISSAHLPANPQVRIAITAPNRHFELQGTIRWISRHSSLIHHREAGIEFTAVPKDLKSFLETVIDPDYQQD